MKKPELLSPAGTFKNMRYALAYGADAVYAGQPRYSLRARNNDFTPKNLAAGIAYSHQRGRKFYVASNISPHNSKVKTYLKDMAPIIDMQPDALIMSDPGLIMMVREAWPDMEIHLSVQANAVNFATVKFWAKQGVSRIILSRELSLEEIAEIKALCPETELEVFVHGSLCIAYSGRCLLSGYMNRRDPNQGTCTNACRWKYNVTPAKETPEGNIIATAGDGNNGAQHTANTVQSVLGAGPLEDGVFLLEEASRPGEYMPAFEDEHGTYIMNSKDLRAVHHVKQLTEMGVDCLKIEGRTKSHYYAARTAQIYRQAIDDAGDGKPFDKRLMDSLENMANRGYTEGFYRRHVHDAYQNYEHGSPQPSSQQFVAEVIDFNDETITVDVKNRFEVGDELELITPNGNTTFTLHYLETLQGKATDVAPGSGHTVKFPNPGGSSVCDMSLLVRNIKKPAN